MIGQQIDRHRSTVHEKSTVTVADMGVCPETIYTTVYQGPNVKAREYLRS